jgi:glycerol-3-phosphate dehydrogenase (NAD(P)+)
MSSLKIGILGSGSWATAIAKIAVDNGNSIHWWIRQEDNITYFKKRHHNPHYLRNAYFNIDLIQFSSDIKEVIKNSDVLVLVIPSIHVESSLGQLSKDIFTNKKIVSAVKGVLPKRNVLLHQYLEEQFGLPLQQYFTLLGPSHAEEVASEQLSYLTFSGTDEKATTEIASCFKSEYINTIVNKDVLGVQYAAVVKNIYAIGAGIAHGLEYGDNFLSVYIANCAREMKYLLQEIATHTNTSCDSINYNASVYLGDLLVTCYSLHSRNRTFGNMIGKGYSVRAAELEMNMVAEGYNASKCIMAVNEQLKIDLPIITAIYEVLWHGANPAEAFKGIELLLV